MSHPPRRPPPLPPSSLPDDLRASCRAAFLTSAVRTARATLEVHGTHLRVVTPAVSQVSAYARRMEVDDLVLAFEQVRSIRRVGLMTAIIELPHRAAVAFTGPTVHSTLEQGTIQFAERRSRPFFVGFWLINHRSGRIHDSRPLP